MSSYDIQIPCGHCKDGFVDDYCFLDGELMEIKAKCDRCSGYGKRWLQLWSSEEDMLNSLIEQGK